MVDNELLMHLAEIAGVFVGFGALISVRSEATRDEEVMMIRQIVVFGIVVVATALFPVMLSALGVAGHGLWLASASVFWVLWWGSSLLNRWDLERTRVLAATPRRARIRMEMPSVPLWLTMNVFLILILTGRFPSREPALYSAAVMTNLLLTAGMLLHLVYLQRSPNSASPGETPTAARQRRGSSPTAPSPRPAHDVDRSPEPMMMQDP